MTREQKIVGVGAASGVVSMALGMWLLSRALPTPQVNGAGERIAYALQWDVLAVLPLVLMIGAIGNARFGNEAIDPTRGAETRAMVINGRVADNTLQQFVLYFTGSLALATLLPAERLGIVGAAAITFFVSRMLFWIGYRIDPLYRAFGFASTFYLNLGLLLGAAWLAPT